MSAKKEKILDKIKKLLALSKSDNVHESARALAQVQKMMKMHNLENADIENSYINCHTSNFKIKAKSVPPQILDLLSLLGGRFPVEIVVRNNIKVTINFNYIYELVFDFYGFNENPEITTYVFDFLARKMQDDRGNFLKSLHKNTKRQTKTEKANAFCMGWLAAVSKKIEDFALNATERQQVKAFIKNKVGNMKNAKDTRKTDFNVSKNMSAINKGFLKGNKVQLNQGVKGTKSEVFNLEN